MEQELLEQLWEAGHGHLSLHMVSMVVGGNGRAAELVRAFCRLGLANLSIEKAGDVRPWENDLVLADDQNWLAESGWMLVGTTAGLNQYLSQAG